MTTRLRSASIVGSMAQRRVQQYLRTVQASSFTNPDCRGGTGNFDFIQQGTSWSVAGFRTRCTVAQGAIQPDGVLACYWNSNRVGAIPQGHVRSAVFRLSDLALTAQPHLFSNSQCFGYPAVTGNSLGDIGISVAFGGRFGGGGTAARAGVGVDDQFTAGTGVFGAIVQTASGVANRSDGASAIASRSIPTRPATAGSVRRTTLGTAPRWITRRCERPLGGVRPRSQHRLLRRSAIVSGAS